MKRKVSLATGALQNRYGHKEAIKIAADIGTDAIDFDLSLNCFSTGRKDSIYTKSDDEIITYFTELGEYARSLGIEIGQTHGRITGAYPPCEENEKPNETLFKDARIDCMATKALGAGITIMHNTTTIFWKPEADPKDMRNGNFDMFMKYMEYAKEFDVKIATETFGDAPNFGTVDFFGDISEFLMTYNRICAVKDYDKYLGICADTGHSNKATRFGNPSPADVIRMCGKNLIALHLNDNDTFTDQHKIPGTGTIDWKDVFDALDEIGYCGNYNMEVSLGTISKNLLIETGEFAVKVMRNMLRERYGNE